MGLVQRSAQLGLELATVDQTREGVVRGAVAHLAGQASLFGHVVKDQHDAEHVATGGADQRSGILDAEFVAITRNEYRVVVQAHDPALCQAIGHGVLSG